MKYQKLLFNLLIIVLLLSTAFAGCTTMTTTPTPIDVGVVLIDNDKEVMWQGNITVEGLTPLAALDEAADAGGFEYQLNAEETYVTGIMGLQESSEGSMWLGWMFFVDGEMPLEAVSDVHLDDDSTLVWFYGSWGETPFT